MSKKLEETLRKYNSNKTFLIVMAIFMCLMSFRFFAKELSSFNVTLYAFNYSYGFMSRGLIGTIWRGIDNILPGDQMTHEALFIFSAIITVIYILVMFVFFCVIIKKCSDKDMRNIRYLILLLSIFAIPIFGTRSNFGRIDLFLFIIVYICLICIINEKAEWICIPLVIVAECIHQGFVFMNINIILVLFFYKIMKRTGKERRKYIIYFALTLICASVFFLYFEFFTQIDGESIYEEIVSTAKSLSYSGEAYSKMLVQHEILGQGVWMDEWRFHKANFVDVPIFVILFLPYLIIGDDVLVAVHDCGRLDVRGVRAGRGLGQGECADRALGCFGQILLLQLLGAVLEDRHIGHVLNRDQLGGGSTLPGQLLDDDGFLHHAHAQSAVLDRKSTRLNSSHSV